MKEYCVGLDYTIREVIERIEKTKNRVVVVVNKEESVVGVVSEGDIIRAMLQGNDLYSRIDSIIRPNYFYLNDKDMEKAYRLFKKYRISLLPIVDDEFRLTGVINIDDVFNYLEGLCKS